MSELNCWLDQFLVRLDLSVRLGVSALARSYQNILESLILTSVEFKDTATGGLRGERLKEFYTIRAELVAYGLGLPPLTSDIGLETWESVASVNPHLISIYVIYNGTLVLLHNIVVTLHEQEKNLYGVKVPDARNQMLEGAQGLVNVASNIKREHTIHAFHVNVILFVSQPTLMLRSADDLSPHDTRRWARYNYSFTL